MFPYLEPAICIRIQRKLNSGLWLVAFGKLGLFMCQSTFATLVCQKNCVFLCKGTKLQKATLFALFGEAEFLDSLPVSSFASENSCFRNSHEQKLQNSAKPNSGDCLPEFCGGILSDFRIAECLCSKSV